MTRQCKKLSHSLYEETIKNQELSLVSEVDHAITLLDLKIIRYLR
jgi:hypothetical protein